MLFRLYHKYHTLKSFVCVKMFKCWRILVKRCISSEGGKPPAGITYDSSHCVIEACYCIYKGSNTAGSHSARYQLKSRSALCTWHCVSGGARLLLDALSHVLVFLVLF